MAIGSAVYVVIAAILVLGICQRATLPGGSVLRYGHQLAIPYRCTKKVEFQVPQPGARCPIYRYPCRAHTTSGPLCNPVMPCSSHGREMLRSGDRFRPNKVW